jgi:hypothetical protein
MVSAQSSFAAHTRVTGYKVMCDSECSHPYDSDWHIEEEKPKNHFTESDLQKMLNGRKRMFVEVISGQPKGFISHTIEESGDVFVSDDAVYKFSKYKVGDVLYRKENLIEKDGKPYLDSKVIFHVTGIKCKRFSLISMREIGLCGYINPLHENVFTPDVKIDYEKFKDDFISQYGRDWVLADNYVFLISIGKDVLERKK